MTETPDSEKTYKEIVEGARQQCREREIERCDQRVNNIGYAVVGALGASGIAATCTYLNSGLDQGDWSNMMPVIAFGFAPIGAILGLGYANR